MLIFSHDTVTFYTEQHMKKLLMGIIFTLSLIPANAQQSGVVTGKPPIDRALVEKYARTIAIAQQTATRATEDLSKDENSPEQSVSTDDALKAIKGALTLGSEIMNAEENACKETGMSLEEFKEVRTRLLQVKMLAQLDTQQKTLLGNTSGKEMSAESIAYIEKELARTESIVAKSKEELENAKAAEPAHYAAIADKIDKQNKSINKLLQDIPKAKNEKQKTAREKQLADARKKLAKYEEEAKKPFLRLERAKERLLKDEQKLAMFKQATPEARAQAEKIGSEVQQYQDQMKEGMQQLQNSDMMQQAVADRPVFEQFPELQVFLLQKQVQ